MPNTKLTTPNLLKQLTAPKIKKTGPRKNKPLRLPQKKRSSAKHNRTRPVNEKTTLAHITNTIVREGGTVPDIGVILGCESSEGSGEWLERLKTEGLSLSEFLKIAKQRADIELIRIATKTALGYEYKEEKQESMPEVDEEGQLTGKFIPGKKTVNKKCERDTGLLKFLLTSRLPQFFSDVKHIEINKRTVELKVDAENEIKSFASGLLKALGEESVDAEFVERPSED